MRTAPSLVGTALAVLIALVLISLASPIPSHAQDHWQHGPNEPFAIASTQTVKAGSATIQIDIAQGDLDLSTAAIVHWIKNAALAVTTYYGAFPVARVHILVVPVASHHGILGGTTWGDIDGFNSFSRLRIGQHTTDAELAADWTMTHELTHTAFPSLPDNQTWMEEGLATYIEPIARVQAGLLPEARIWNDMMHDMPKGEPESGDAGLDHTTSWGRTYWGGAMFCLVADVAIRRQTNNKKGLQDALRAIVREGGTNDHDWPLMRALAIGDRATGTTVLTTQYKQWADTPSPADLDTLWKQLGVSTAAHGAAFDDAAPLAKIRQAIVAKHP